MRVYISVDMEGISGVTRWEDVVARGQDYQRARSWMTADVNAAVTGAREGGATDFVVEENHGIEMLCNLVLDEIDPDVEVVRGIPRGGMATTAFALDSSFDAMFLVGHHAKVGDYPGICAHTISYEAYADVRLGGRTISEGEIFATIAAQAGVPTALIAGDDVITADLEKQCPGITTAVVKRALSRTGAAIIPPKRAAQVVRNAARLAVERVRDGAVSPLDPAPPFEIEVELRAPLGDASLEAVSDRFPEMTVIGDRTIGFAHDDMSVAYRMAAIVSGIASQPQAVKRY